MSIWAKMKTSPFIWVGMLTWTELGVNWRKAPRGTERPLNGPRARRSRGWGE